MGFKTDKIEFSPIKRIQAEAEGEEAVSLAQGIPKFLTPSGIREAAATAIEQGRADFYGPPQGISSLRKKIASSHLREEGVHYDPGEVIITSGALQGMSAALVTLLSPGDELIVLSPTYFPFLNLPKIFGIRPVFVSLEKPDWRLRVEKLERSVTEKTRAILLVHPNNPTGTVYSKEELMEILKLAKKNNFFVFVDETYRYFTYESDYPLLGQFGSYQDQLIRVMSFSKAFALSGWRVGYLLAKGKISSEIMKVHEMMTTASASLPAQYAALAALSNFPNLPIEFGGVLQERRARMKRRLEKLSSIFAFKNPQGAYYFFVQLLGGEDDRYFSDRLLKEGGVAVVPGSTFGREGRGYIRLSFAAKEGEIDEAFDRLERYFFGEESKLTSLEKIAYLLKDRKKASKLLVRQGRRWIC